MLNKLKPDDYKKISGGGGTWTSDEELTLMGLLCSINYPSTNLQRFKWDEAVSDLNKIYGNSRTIAECKLKITQEKINSAIQQNLI